MRIFMTGATGYIGSAVASLARDHGHEVIAAAHTPAMLSQLAANGFTPVMADLADPAALSRYARTSDAVIHAGFAAGADAAEVDRRATEALVTAMGRSRRPFVYTSGVWVLGPNGDSVADERSPIAPIEAVGWRGALELWLQEQTARGAHAVVVRPGVVHGHGGGIPGKTATGALPVVGRGTQRWSVVHVEDLAALYVAAAERAKPGAILHGVAEVVSVAELVGDGPLVRHEDLATALAALGPFAEALAITQVVSSAETQATIGWTPQRFVARATLAGVGGP